MKIIEIGNDLVEKKIFEKFDNNKIKRLLTKKELSQYLLKPNNDSKLNYLSSRWTAKEAIFKAINSYIKINLNNIEILNDSNGKPFCTNIDNIKLSITYSSKYTLCTCIFIKE